MIKILGDGQIPEAQALYDVRDALDFEQDVYLLAQLAPVLGIELRGEVIYNMEPLSDDCRSFTAGYLDVLKANTVIDYSWRNVEYLKRHGVDAFYMPYGHHDSLVRPVEAEKDIDILFVGSPNKRRHELLGGMTGLLWVTGVYGADLDALIQRAKVVLNVHYSAIHPLESARINYLLANGCNVVSERSNNWMHDYLYGDALHWVDGDIQSACEYALDNPRSGKAPPHDCSAAQAWLNSQSNGGFRCLGQ